MLDSSEMFRIVVAVSSFLFFFIASLPRERRKGFARSLGLWCVAQCSLLIALMQNKSVIVWILGTELAAWIYGQMSKTLFPESKTRSIAMPISHSASLIAVLVVAASFPFAHWGDLSLAASETAERVANPARLVFGLIVFQLVLRSGFLYNPGSNSITARQKLLELCGLGIPSLLLGWSLLESYPVTLPPAYGTVGLLLGVLVFVVFQWIGFSRNNLPDFAACMSSAYAALFWSVLVLYSHSFPSTDALFALLWSTLLAIVGLLVFLSWLEEEQDVIKERGIRGLLSTYPGATIPAVLFVLGLAGQPWLAAGALRLEAGSLLLDAGATFAIALFFGWILQSGKALHLSLAFAIPKGPQTMAIQPRVSKVLLLWALALLCVLFGLLPNLLRSNF